MALANTAALGAAGVSRDTADISGGEIVRDAKAAGDFRDDIDPMFASMWFYGAIEQLLSGWVFDLIPGEDGDFERAKELVVETICGGLEPRGPDG
jgi:hypothetical protein